MTDIINEIVYTVFDDRLQNEISTNKIKYWINCGTLDAEFSIEQGEVCLHQLVNCKHANMSGTDILNKLIHISNILKMPISLLDVSFIKIDESCEYSLSHFYILLNGQSWYNKYGFISCSHDINVEHNNEIRKLPLSTFVQLATDKYIEKNLALLKEIQTKYENPGDSSMLRRMSIDIIERHGSIDNYMKPNFDKIQQVQLLDIADFVSNFEITETTPVNEIIESIYNEIKLEKPLSTIKFQLLKKLIDCSEHVLNYDAFLERTPTLAGGTKRKLKKRTVRKKTRSRS